MVVGEAPVPPRLIRRVLDTPPGGVCLIRAPSGMGTSCLLRAAATRAQAPIVWLTLAGRPDDPARLWSAFAARLVELGVDAGPVRAALTAAAEGHAHAAGGVAAVLAGLGPLVMVIDDLDTRRQPWLAEHVLRLLERQPPTCRAFVRMRLGAPPALGLLRSSGRLALLDADALRLDRAEALAAVHAVAPRLPAEPAEALVQLADGWVAPIVTAARVAALDRHVDPAGWLLASGVDLLAAGELARLDRPDRELLTTTSVLDVLTPAACDALTARRDSALALDRLAATGLVVRPEPGPRAAYRLHPLFAEHLRHRLAAQPAGAGAKAHAAAARWYEQEDDVERAVQHLSEAGDLAAALRLLARTELHPVAAFWDRLLGGDLAAARAQLRRMDDAVAARDGSAAASGTSSTPAGELLAAERALAHGVLSAWDGYPARALGDTLRARALVRAPGVPPSAQFAAFHAVRLHLWRGELEAARTLLVGLQRHPRTREYHRVRTVPALSAGLAAADGRAHRAVFLAREALSACTDDAGVLGLLQGADARLALAWGLTELDRLPAARDAARAVLRSAREAGHVGYEVLALLRLAGVHAAAGAGQATEQVLAEVRDVIDDRCPGSDLLAVADVARARAFDELGDPRRARAAARRLPRGPERELILIRWATRPDVLAAVRRIRRARPRTTRQQVRAGVLLAGTLASPQPDEARTHLRAAAATASDLGLHRALVGCPEQLRVLAGELARVEPSPALDRLLEVARAHPVVGAGRVRPGHAPPQVSAELSPAELSPGELQLVRLLAAAPTANADLARALGVSVSTVKTRLRRLYAKLGVHDRQQAVARAQQLGLAPPRA